MPSLTLRFGLVPKRMNPVGDDWSIQSKTKRGMIWLSRSGLVESQRGHAASFKSGNCIYEGNRFYPEYEPRKMPSSKSGSVVLDKMPSKRKED